MPERGYTGLPQATAEAVTAGQSDAVDSVCYPHYSGRC